MPSAVNGDIRHEGDMEERSERRDARSADHGPAVAPATSKIVPPDLPPGFVPRPRLHDLLSEALRRRLTLVVAGPGFGKSALLAGWEEGVSSAWYTLDAGDHALGAFARGLVSCIRLRVPAVPADLAAAVGAESGPGADDILRAEAVAGLLSEAAEAHLKQELALILDDVHELQPGTAAAALIEAICRQAPARLHVVLASRAEPPFSIQRMRGRGQVVELSARELSFSVDEVEAVLRAAAVEPSGLTGPLHEMSRGWPAAVRLAADMLRTTPAEERAAAVGRLAAPAGPIFEYLAEEVLRPEPPEVRALLATASRFDRFTPELCEELGVERADELLGRLSRRGVFVENLGGGEGWMRLNPMVRHFLHRHGDGDEETSRDLHRRAAAWFSASAHDSDALRSLVEAGDRGALAEFLIARGERLVETGMARAVAAAIEGFAEDRPSQLDAISGIAHQALGEWDEALRTFARVPDPSRPAIAWRIGYIHYLRGETEAARAAFGRGRIGAGDTADEAQLLAWTAALHWMQGDAEACRAASNRALAAATACGDLRALATSHTALAMLAALEGDRRANDAHYLKALDAAERAGDLFQVVRIRTNRASNLYEEGWYERAREELDLAIRLGEAAGFTPVLGLAYSNRGWTALHQGNLDDAVGDFQVARQVYQRLDSRRVAYPLVGLGDVYRERGDLALARASYEEAIRHSEEGRDLQGLVPALAGLGRVLVSEDPEAAVAACERAVGVGANLDQISAVLAQGWVALLRGDRDRAQELGRSAALLARERRDRAGLAESLELQAMASERPDRSVLEEAHRLWAEVGNRLAVARLAYVTERIDGRTAPDEPTPAERRLAAFGVRLPAVAAGVLGALPTVARDVVSIRTLGGFALVRNGRAVPASEWQSKKSRDLLKVLVARRGRPAHREVLIETLWPDDDDLDSASNRLSVALSGVRSALDPEKRFPADHYITGDRESVGLAIEHLDVDIERFLDLVQRGQAALRDEEQDEALRALEAAEGLYAGDFLEEDAYEEWVIPLREEARAAYISAMRALGEGASSRGDLDTTMRCSLRILERDPFDESAALALVRSAMTAGRHGEARRHYQTYVNRMRELDVDPAPFPSSATG